MWAQPLLGEPKLFSPQHEEAISRVALCRSHRTVVLCPVNRRKVLQRLAALLAIWPGISLGQSPNRVPVIGVPLIYAGPNDPLMIALREGLRERGYVDGESIRIEHRFAEGKIERLDALVQELVRLNVDIFVAGAAPIARAQRRASATTPIVLVSWDYDPVAVGIIETMSRPGGNITGIYPRTPETLGKRLQMLKEARPGLSRVAAVYDRWGPDRRYWSASLPAFLRGRSSFPPSTHWDPDAR